MDVNYVKIFSSSNGIIRKRHSLTSKVAECTQKVISEQHNSIRNSQQDVSSFEGNIIQYLQKNDSWIKTAVFLRWLLTDEGMTAIVPCFLWIMAGTDGMLLMASLSLNELVNGCIKWICQRPRPFWTNSKIKNIGRLWEDDFGFPSSHAQTIACFFSCILFQYELVDRLHESMNLGYLLLFIFLLSLVFASGIARVYLGVHYPSDVIVGWMIGLAVPIVLQSVDLFTWFIKLGSPYRLYFSIVVPFLIYSCFATLRYLLPKPQFVSAWEETAHRNELVPSLKTIQTFRLSKYSIQIWSLTGGLVAASMAMEDYRLRFVLEACHWEHILPYSLPRTLLGYTVLIFLLFPFTFVLPKIFSRRYILSFVLKCTGAFFIGWWALYGCPKLADIALNASCPLHPPLTASPMIRMEVDQLKNKCHLNQYTPHRTLPLLDDHTNLFRPTSIEELQAFVRKQDSRTTVLRVFGSGHSQLFEQQFEFHPTTSSTKKIVYIQLSAPAFTKYQILSIGEDNVDRRILIEAGAGLHVGENKYMNISRQDSLLYKMAQDNLSFDNVPTIVHQTLGSVISTGSEGGSFHSFFKQVVGLRLVDGRGDLHMLWRNATENLEFRGALLSMGLMGILVSVVIAPSRQFCVMQPYNPTPAYFEFPVGNDHEQTPARSQTIHTLVNQIQDTFAENDYSGYFLVSTTQTYIYGSLPKGYNRTHRAVVANSFRMNRTIDVTVPTCGDLSKPEIFSEHPKNSFFFLTAAQLTVSLLSNILMQPACMKNKTVFFDLLAQSDVYTRLIEMGRTNQAIQISLERCLSEINKFAFDTLETHGINLDLYAACSMTQWTPPYRLIETVRQPTLGPSHIVLPLNHIVDLQLMDVSLHSVYFPIYNSSYLKRVLEVYWTEIISRPEDSICSEFFTEIYACPANDALMSPTRGLPSICFSIISMKRSLDSYAQVYRKFWQLFERHGLSFIVHWSKTLPIRQQDQTTWCNIRAQYQNDGAWSKFKTLVENFDPIGVFRDAYWHERFWMDDC